MSLFAKFWLPVVLLVVSACGARPPAVSRNIISRPALAEQESVALIIAAYRHFRLDGQDRGAIDARIAKIQEKYEGCLSAAVRKLDRPLRILPAEEFYNTVLQIEIPPIEEARGIILTALKEKAVIRRVNDAGLRYLALLDIDTRRDKKVEFDMAGSHDTMVIGWADEGSKSSRAEASVVDTRTGEQATRLTLTSEGKHGWVAGVCCIVILPVPFYWAWWSLPESEICGPLGAELAMLFRPQPADQQAPQ